MSQSRPTPAPVQGSGISSTASAQNARPAAAPYKSDDPTWAHCSLPDLNKKHQIKCNYCSKICTAGITRVKYHLAGITKCGVAKCPGVPTDVKEQMIALLAKSTEEKEQKAKEKKRGRAAVNIENSEGENSSEDDSCNEVVVLKTTKAGSSGSIDKFYKSSVEESVKKNKIQTKLSTQEREKWRDRTCEYIAQFFYEASIPHNCVTLPSFDNMIEAIGRFGKDLKGPSAYELSGPLLQKRKKKVMDSFVNHKNSWEQTGCSVMTDAWTDRKSRGVMNLVVHSAHGVLFLDSVDCSSDKKDGKYIFDLVDNCIEDIGADKVVQVVTDNASVNVAAASLMKAKRPSIFWNGCAAHCIDLMLEDIGKLKPVEKIIADARQVTAFLYAHTRVLAMMRKALGRDLIRAGITRFATAYLNLKSLQDHKKELQKLFRSDDLNDLGYLKKDKGKKSNKVVRSEAFWKGVDTAVNFFEPMANVLRRMDSDVPAMGFFHGCMLDAKKEISYRFDNDESRFKVVIDIIDKRWDNKLKSPLHLAGYFLNPYYYYPNKVQIERDGSFRASVIGCVTRMIQDEETQDKIIEEITKYEEQKDSFGQDIATRQRRNKNFDPAKWWRNHGTSSPNLRILAQKILSLTCSSSACERNWSTFEQVHTKKRSRLLHDRMRDLVFVKFNSKMKYKRHDKNRDPIEKEIADILEDDENEFITGIVPNARHSEGNEPGKQGESHGATPSEQTKRKRSLRKKKSLQSLLNNCEDPAASTSDSESEDDQHQDGDDVYMVNSDSSDADSDC